MTTVVLGFEDVKDIRVNDTTVDEELVKNISGDIGYTLGSWGPESLMPPPFGGYRGAESSECGGRPVRSGVCGWWWVGGGRMCGRESG